MNPNGGAPHVGVDGCRAGWFAVYRDGFNLRFGVFARVADVSAAFPTAGTILIDIPIGLPWNRSPMRTCDRLARRLLGVPRRSSVFPVPCRAALRALSHEEAKGINAKEIGRSLTVQTWGIAPKIAEVDAFLTGPERSVAFREVHPEVCFWALAGHNAMAHAKDTREGIEERLRTLEKCDQGVRDLLRDALRSTKRQDLAPDDVLDACVALITAEGKQGSIAALTGEPLRDECGLPMEMVYLTISDGHPADVKLAQR